MDVYGAIPVTGEAVALDLRVARLGSRILALMVDVLIQGAILYGLGLIGLSVFTDADTALQGTAALVVVVAVLVGYPTVAELLTKGRSVGKLALGLRVVRDDGGPVRLRHSLVRQLFMVFEFWLTSGSVGLFVSLLSAQGKRAGDHFAGTIVISERVPSAARLPTYVPMPEGMAGWAATADLVGVTDVAAGQARSLLGRWNELAPQVRDQLAFQLAQDMSLRATPPPPACPPASYLAAVVSERARRASLPAGYG